MNAIEARNKAEKINTDEANAAYQNVMKAIENAVNRGDYSCTVDLTLKDDLQKKLKGMGYKLDYQHGDYRDGSYYKISW